MTNYIFEDMNTEALAEGYTPDNRYRYIRPTELAPIIPGSYIVHQFYLIDPEVNNVANIYDLKVQYAFGLKKLFEKTAALVQLKDACEATVQLTPEDTEQFIRDFPEINVPKQPYLSAYCQLIVTTAKYIEDPETQEKQKQPDKVIYSDIQDIKVKLPLKDYIIDERTNENDA